MFDIVDLLNPELLMSKLIWKVRVPYYQLVTVFLNYASCGQVFLHQNNQI